MEPRTNPIPLWTAEKDGRQIVCEAEIETNLWTAITPALRLSSMALVWSQGAAFELPGIQGRTDTTPGIF
jgi:hypothetical protein